jgi:hypothetical protein
MCSQHVSAEMGSCQVTHNRQNILISVFFLVRFDIYLSTFRYLSITWQWPISADTCCKQISRTNKTNTPRYDGSYFFLCFCHDHSYQHFIFMHSSHKKYTKYRKHGNYTSVLLHMPSDTAGNISYSVSTLKGERKHGILFRIRTTLA